MVPVMLHIPKNAGTYIQHVVFKYFVRTKQQPGQYIRKITVEQDNINITAFCNFKTDYWKTDPNMKRHPVSVMRDVNNPRAGWCTLDTFNTYLQNDQFDTLFYVAEPVGMNDMRLTVNQIHKLIDATDDQAINFTILRESFSRQQSLYYYLRGEESIHEPSHDKFTCDTFKQHLVSDQLEDSWLVRVLTGNLNMPVDQGLFDQACSYLDTYNFLIGDIRETDQLLDRVLQTCFECTTTTEDRKNPHHNSTKIENKITIDDLDQQTKQKVLDRTYWDRKIYERYIK